MTVTTMVNSHLDTHTQIIVEYNLLFDKFKISPRSASRRLEKSEFQPSGPTDGWAENKSGNGKS
jgi:hypothetical protein